jgi:prolycopene isomerase
MMEHQLKVRGLAAKIIQKEKYPVAIVGSGLGGLMAGACLAKNGFPVTLFEKHHKLGGYATQFKRNRFVFDVSLTRTIANGPVEPLLEEAGVRGKVEPVLLPELIRIITPDCELVYPQQNPDAIIKLLSGKFPAEKKGISGFIKKMLEITGMEDPARDPTSRLTLEEFLDKHVKDPRLKTFLGIFSGRCGKSRAELPAVFYARAAGALMKYGASYYKRRSQDFSDAFVDTIMENGGVVKKNTEVTKILMKNNSVNGVEFQETQGYDESEIQEAKAVIANMNIPGAIKMLPEDQVPAGYLETLSQYEPSVSMFNIWLGLNHDISNEIKEYEIFVNDSYDEEKNLQAINDCDPEHVPYYVTVYNNAYEGYQVNPHSSIVSIRFLCGYEPWRKFEEAYLRGKKKDYTLQKDQITKILIERAEKQVIPGLPKMIKTNVSATPLTIKRYTGNRQGAIYGYRQTLNNSGACRVKNKTPIDGLYFASAWGEPGCGYDNVLESGFISVITLLKDWINGGGK